jgi:hypothetical protein
VVAFLAQVVEGGRTESVVDFEGSLDESSIVDDACGSTIALFSASIIAGDTYINVHSTENPGGEVRAQILGVVAAPTAAPTEAPTSASPHFFKLRGASVGLVVALVAFAAM